MAPRILRVAVIGIATTAATAGAGEGATVLQCRSPVASSLCFEVKKTIATYKAGSLEAASIGACCTACSVKEGCKSWQLITTKTSQQECWLMDSMLDTEDKTRNTCQSGGVPPVERFNRTTFEGTWVQHGKFPQYYDLGFVIGSDTGVRWKDVEIRDGVFDWTIADDALHEAAAAGLYIETSFAVGPESPKWLYEASVGVPAVEIIPSGAKHDGQPKYFPYYLDNTYQQRFLLALERFAEHIESLPPFVRSKIIAVQAMYGSTGDDTPWHGTPKDQAYAIDLKAWNNFTMSLAPRICEIYRNQNLHVLWNMEPDRLERLTRECPGSFIKVGMASHGLQVNYEIDDYEAKGKICHQEGYHCRGETWPFCQQGFFKEAPAWNTYWHILWQLTFGNDIVGMSAVPETLRNPAFTSFFEMFNKYAVSVRPPADKWPGAIIALRDGLDSNDTLRFPEDRFGTASQTNKERLLAIANHFESHGAAEGDPDSAAGGAMQSRRANSMNDVGWRIWRGNYGNGLLTQVDPEGTSVGWWRVGPKDQPYGRWARSFEHSSKRTALGFTLDKRLWGGLPLNGKVPLLHLRVIHLDEGSGSFDILYDDASSNCKSAKTVMLGNSNRWVITDLILQDGYFGRRCGFATYREGADLVLSGDGEHDVKLHGLEIFREEVSSTEAVAAVEKSILV